jgi:MFS family permease
MTVELEQGSIEELTQSPGANAWVVCFVASLFFFYEFIQMNMFSAINSAVMQAFQINATQLGTLSAFYFVANMIFLFFAGSLLDRYSTRAIILQSMFICILGTFLFSQAQELWVAQFSRFLTGIGSAFCFLCCVRLASRWFPPEKMAVATGFIITLGMFGGVVAQAPTAMLMTSLTWREALLVDSALGIVIFSLIALIVQDYPNSYFKTQEGYRKELKQLGLWQSICLSMMRGQNWLAGMITSLLNMTPIYLLGGVWGSLYLQQIHHMNPTQATTVTQMVFLGTIIGSPIVGLISDKIKLRREPMLVGTLLALIILFPIIFLDSVSVPTMMILFFLLGLVTSVQILGYPIVAESNPKSLTATAVSVVSIATISGGAIFQPLFGWIMDQHWQGVMSNGVHIYNLYAFREAMLIMPIGFVISFIAILLLKETHCCYQE